MGRAKLCRLCGGEWFRCGGAKIDFGTEERKEERENGWAYDMKAMTNVDMPYVCIGARVSILVQRQPTHW